MVLAFGMVGGCLVVFDGVCGWDAEFEDVTTIGESALFDVDF